MSALARLLLGRGDHVSGCDLHSTSLTLALQQEGTLFFEGHNPSHLKGVDLVVITAAIRPDNLELQQAHARGTPVLKRAELLGQLMTEKRDIAVAGTHGKTTTSSLIAWTLVKAGLDPTVLVGGETTELGGNARGGNGEWLVAEADEYDASFLTMRPEIAVVTNIEAEHLDFYKDMQGVVNAFSQFLQGVPANGHVVFCLDDPVLAGLESTQHMALSAGENRPYSGGVLSTGSLNVHSLVSYGFHPAARWRGEDVTPNSLGGSDFRCLRDGAAFADFSLRIPGQHNVSNALAAIATADLLGIDKEVMRDALSTFGGVKRRFQVVGEANGVTIVDDYAHHPTEVRATLAAARQRYGDRRIICVFQPHTYSRTKLLMPLYVGAFKDADAVYITDIYAAREDNTWGVTGQELAGALAHRKVTFIPSIAAVAEELPATLKPDDVVMLLGAGDIYTVGPQLVEALFAELLQKERHAR